MNFGRECNKNKNAKVEDFEDFFDRKQMLGNLLT